MGEIHSGNSIERIFGAQNGSLKELPNLSEDLKKGYLDGRKAVSYLINNIDSNRKDIIVIKGKDGKLNWKVGGTTVNFSDATVTKPSFWSRIKHRLKMIFSSEYKTAFKDRIDKIVNAYNALFDSEKNRANQVQSEAQAKADAEAQAKAEKIADLKTQIEDKKAKLEELQKNKTSSLTEIKTVREVSENFIAEKSEAESQCKTFLEKYKALKAFDDLPISEGGSTSVFGIEIKLTTEVYDKALLNAQQKLSDSSDKIQESDYRKELLSKLKTSCTKCKKKFDALKHEIVVREQFLANEKSKLDAANEEIKSVQDEIKTLIQKLHPLEPQDVALEGSQEPNAGHNADPDNEPETPDTTIKTVDVNIPTPSPDEPEMNRLLDPSYLKAREGYALDHPTSTYYASLSEMERNLYDMFLAIGGGVNSAPVANLITSLIHGRLKSAKLEDRTLIITLKAGKGTLKIEGNELSLFLPSSLNFSFDEKTRKWQLQGKLQVTYFLRTFDLDKTEILIQNHRVYVDIKDPPLGTGWLVDVCREGGKGLAPSRLLLGLECVNWS